MTTELTGAELIFAKRMLPHFLAGKSPASAAQAVLEDDARIFGAFCDRRHSYFVDFGDGRSADTPAGKGDLIAAEITATVYERLRQAA